MNTKIGDETKHADKYKRALYIIIGISFILRIVLMILLTPQYNLHSDDIGYINSAKTFLSTFSLERNNRVTAQVMPGMTWLLSIFIAVFGTGELFWIVTKLFWISMGVFTIYGVYRLAARISSPLAGLIAAVFMLSLDFAWMDNIILTETPFMLLFVLLLDQSIAFMKDKKGSNFWGMFVCYFLSVLIRPNLIFFPVLLAVFLFACKINMRKYLKQMVIAAICLCLFFIPWTIRNYVIFKDFIPLTYGVGNPLLLGTYQGVGYPDDKTIDYNKEVLPKLPNRIIDGIKQGRKNPLNNYYMLKYDEAKAKYRIAKWWNTSKKSFLFSYLYLKPKLMIQSAFLWVKILCIDKTTFIPWRTAEFFLFISGFIVCMFSKKTRVPVLLLFCLFFVMLFSYASAFAFNRYIETSFFIEFVIIGCGTAAAVDKAKQVAEFIRLRKHQITPAV